jgi:DNA-binding Lrp family transcriptional regulator
MTAHTSPPPAVPVSIDDPINAQILAVSEDRIAGFQAEPFAQISQLCGLDIDTVLERIRAMLEAGTIRRVRQTLMATNLAPGALVAWRVEPDRLDAAFEFMSKKDPFSGHVVVRSTDADTPGSAYRLWTTLKVPQGFSMTRHCDYLCTQTGAQAYLLMPAKRLFSLGVGHIRRRTIEPGSKTEQLGKVIDTQIAQLDNQEWRVLMAMKSDFTPEEVRPDPWRYRAEAAQIPVETFLEVGKSLNDRGVIGRFSTFLEHVKPLADGQRVTRFNALFHWAVPQGREIEAGREVGRHHILTHAYWREAGEEFGNVNIMAVAHGIDKDLLLRHKAAIDEHLESVGIPVSYTNVFWGGRSEIIPSEISPIAYRQWCEQVGLDPQQMGA